MDTKKLAKIIKLIVEQEMKKQLPTLIKEGVQRELKKMYEEQVPQTHLVEERDPFSLAAEALENDRKSNSVNTNKSKRHFTSNPILNEILNETEPFGNEVNSVLDSNTSLNEGVDDMDKTISLNSNSAQLGLDGLRASMAAKMGYGDLPGTGAQSGGLGVQTGVPIMDKVLNRDYTALVKKFNKK